MKKALFILMLFINVVNSYSQIYNIREKLDKFDDIVFTHNEKIIITTNFEYGDSTIIFEVKGQNPVTYYVFGTEYNGSRINAVNIINDLYGCEEYYYCSLVNKSKISYDLSLSTNKNDSDVIITEYHKKFMDSFVTITHRTISTYSFKTYGNHEFPYKTDLWWIRFKDGSRIIYRKQ